MNEGNHYKPTSDVNEEMFDSNHSESPLFGLRNVDGGGGLNQAASFTTGSGGGGDGDVFGGSGGGGGVSGDGGEVKVNPVGVEGDDFSCNLNEETKQVI